MDRIVLEVDNAAANAYRNFTVDAKQKFSRVISLFLKKATNDATSKDYQKMLDDMGTEAKKNGLTQETLNELLKNND